MEDDDSKLDSMNSDVLEEQMEATDDVSQENSAEIIESMRASLLEDNSPNGSFSLFPF